MESLRNYIDLRHKYIHLFKTLAEEDVPLDVKKLIFEKLETVPIPLYHQFDKSINAILSNMKFNKIANLKLTPDAYHLLNYILVVFINDLVSKVKLVVNYRMAKRIIAQDFEYVFGVYPKKDSKLIIDMIEDGQDALQNYEENKNLKGRRGDKAHTLIEPSVVEHEIKNCLHQEVDYVRKGKVVYMDDVQVGKESIIYLTGALDKFVETILVSSLTNKKMLHADDILAGCENNEEIQSLLLDLFL